MTNTNTNTNTHITTIDIYENAKGSYYKVYGLYFHINYPLSLAMKEISQFKNIKSEKEENKDYKGIGISQQQHQPNFSYFNENPKTEEERFLEWATETVELAKYNEKINAIHIKIQDTQKRFIKGKEIRYMWNKIDWIQEQYQDI